MNFSILIYQKDTLEASYEWMKIVNKHIRLEMQKSNEHLQALKKH